MRLGETVLAIGALLATSMPVVAASPPPAPVVSPPAAAPADPWLRLVDGDPRTSVRALYRRLRMEQAQRSDQPPPQEPVLASTHDTMLELGDPARPRLWTFEGDAGRAPRRAFALSNLDGEAYGLIAEVHCDDTPTACAEYRRGIQSMRSRPPISGFTLDPAARAMLDARYHSWVRLVQSEPCEDAPASPQTVRYPPTAVREQASGQVLVRVVYNSCGEIRDASIQKSAGHRDLDRAALAAVRSWRLGRDAVKGQSGIGIFPITFSMD